MNTKANNSDSTQPSRDSVIHEPIAPSPDHPTTGSLFTQPRVLQQIGHLRIAKFLDGFTGDLASLNLVAPPLEPMTHHYFGEVADFLSKTEVLPIRLLHAMGALESAAAPENVARLDAIIQRRIPCVAVPQTCALDRALEVWFAAPEELEPFKAQSSTVHSNPPLALLPPPAFTSFSSSTSDPATLEIRPETLDSGATDAAAFAALAALSPADYDRTRKQSARELRIRVETLDAEVTRVRNQIRDDEAFNSALSTLHSPIPWPEPVNGAELLTQIAERFRHYVFLPPGAAEAFTLWSAHAHCFCAFTQSPRLNLSSPEPGCGKTTALDLIAAFTPRALRTENLTAPVLFRLVHQYQPTLLLDEVDAWLPQAEELRGLLNAGHKRGACAYRCDGEGNAVRPFRAFSPAALAGIGALPGTLHDRSVFVPLVKAKPHEVPARFNDQRAELENELCRKLARWTADNFEALKSCDPSLPPTAFNRLADNWRPLFAIAQIAGDPWPGLALDSFNHLAKPRLSPRLSAQNLGFNGSAVQPFNNSSDHHSDFTNSHLINCIRSIFTQSAATRLSSQQLANALNALSDQSTNPSSHKSVFTPVSLSRRLGNIGIKSKTLRLNGHLAKGYDLSDFPQPS